MFRYTKSPVVDAICSTTTTITTMASHILEGARSLGPPGAPGPPVAAGTIMYVVDSLLTDLK